MPQALKEHSGQTKEPPSPTLPSTKWITNMAHYRIPQKQKAIPFLYTELTEDERIIMALTSLNHIEHNLSQLDFVIGWRNFIESAFANSPESNTPCWHGHYDQFGIIMLYLFERASEYISGNLEDEWFRDIEHFSGLLHDAVVPQGSPERMFYRAWLSLIGHPDFVHLAVSSDRIEAPNICLLHWLMGAALTRISEDKFP